MNDMARDLILGQAIADAITYRTDTGRCTACGDDRMCGDHVADFEQAAVYLRLAAELGITVPR